MKKIVAFLFIAFALFSITVKAENLSGTFYLGAGINQQKSEIPISREEAWFASAPTTISSNRQEENNSTGKNLFLGYQLSNVVAIELGYLAEVEARSSTTGTVHGNLPTTDGTLGASIIVPFFVHQNKVTSGLHISFIGQKNVSDSTSIFGRVGVLSSTTTSSQNITYNCNPVSCDPYQDISKKEKNLGSLLGFGIATNLLEHVTIRAELMKASTLPEVIRKVDVVFSF